jgi:hypothetical protein
MISFLTLFSVHRGMRGHHNAIAPYIEAKRKSSRHIDAAIACESVKRPS